MRIEYTKDSLISLCTDILGDIDSGIPLPILVEMAAIELFRTDIRCNSLSLELRTALNDLHRKGEFNFTT